MTSGELIGYESVSMFSLQHMGTGLWFNIGPDGGIRMDAPNPVPMGEFYTGEGTETEEFSFKMLEWVKRTAGINEVRQGRWVDIHPIDVDRIVVCRFDGQRPSLLKAG